MLTQCAILQVAGYCMYGTATELMLTFGSGVHRFTLDPSLGEFIHVESNVRIPEAPKKIYSCNQVRGASFRQVCCCIGWLQSTFGVPNFYSSSEILMYSNRTLS